MKKVLLSSVAALAVFSAVAPVFATGPDTFGNFNTDGSPKTVKPAPAADKGDNNRFGGTSDAVIAGKTNEPITVKTADTNKHVRVTVLDGGGRPVPGATIDFMLNGFSIGSAVTDQSGDAEAPRLFNKGEVVEFRVGTTANDFKELVTATGSVTVSNDMYTNGSVTLPYKLDDRAATINSNSKDVKPSDKDATKPDATKPDATKPDATKPDAQDQAKKADEAAKKAGVNAKAGQKALPKTHAAK